jgi:hypothetical protein
MDFLFTDEQPGQPAVVTSARVTAVVRLAQLPVDADRMRNRPDRVRRAHPAGVRLVRIKESIEEVPAMAAKPRRIESRLGP